MADLYRYPVAWDDPGHIEEVFGRETLLRMRHDEINERNWRNLSFPETLKYCAIHPGDLGPAIKLALDAALFFSDAWPASFGGFDIARFRRAEPEGYYDRMFEGVHPITNQKVMYFSCPDNDGTVLHITRLLDAIEKKGDDELELDENLKSACKRIAYNVGWVGNPLRNAQKYEDRDEYVKLYKYFFGGALEGVKREYSHVLERCSVMITTQDDRMADVGVFLSYVREDRNAAIHLYHRLHQSGQRPWIDEHNLLPGQDWELEIRRAIRHARNVIVCLSPTSVDKRGYFQKEIHTALSVLEEIPDRQIYLIPVRLSPCDVPERLQGRQWVDLFSENGYERLVTALATGR